MGCVVSKSPVEPRTVTIKFSSCSKLTRRHSSPVRLAHGEHLAMNSRPESDHVVSLTSSTYGSLCLDTLPNQGEERTRATSGSMGNVTAEHATSGRSGWKQVGTINVWEDIENEKAALQVLRGLMGNPKVSGHDSGKRSPCVYHTLEDVDSVLEVRRSFTSDYGLRRDSSMDSVTEKMTGLLSPILLKRRSQALQISQEVIEELDDLRRRNLSRSQEYGFTRRRNLAQIQEFNPTGRSEVSRSQEFYSRARRDYSQSQAPESVRRISLTRNQQRDPRKIRNLSRSYEFVRPALDDPKEGFSTRHSSETPRTVQIKDEWRIALSKPDVVLRSPMLRGLSGQERFVSSDATNIERRNKPLLQGQAQAWKTTLPRAAGCTKVSLNIVSAERRSSKVLEPKVASAVAALSRLGEQKSASMAPSVPETKAEVSQDQSSSTLGKTNFSVSKIPTYGPVATVTENTQLTSPQDHDQEGRKLSTLKKQSDRSPPLTTAASGHEEQSAALISSTSQASFRKQACEKSSTSQDMCSQGEPESLLDDPISSGYELVTKAEVAEAVLGSGSVSEEQPRKHSDLNINRNNSWRSARRDSPPLDPELLASFEEALEMFTADDWCTVRIGESDDAADTSRSTSDADSPSWMPASPDHLDTPAGDARLNTFQILENHVEKPHAPQREKLASSKVAPLSHNIDELKTTKPNPLEKFETKCPPGGEARCVLYTTSMRGIRKTFEDCSHMRRILQSSNVQIDERDIAMHGEFRHELNGLVGRAAPVPRLFLRGRYVGGVEDVALMVEDGSLTVLLEDLPRQASAAVCDGCGGVRFVPCAACRGSCKVVAEDGHVARCEDCNENGLCRCPLCL